MSSDRIREIEDKLENEDLSSHKRDELKRELNRLRDQQNGSSSDIYRTVGIAVLAIALVAGAGYALSAAGIVNFQVSNTPTGNSGGEPISPSDIDMEGEPTLGDEDAPVTVIEYGDFQCPVCQNFESQVFHQLKSEYIDSGQVKFVWKDFPLTQIHDWAQIAASTQECVYQQDEDAFWAVKEKIFANQGDLTVSNAQSQIVSWAEEEGVAESDVEACMANENPINEVQSDLGEGQSLGVQGTPTVFIEGQRLRGLNSYGQYSQIIESELARQDSDQ